MRKYKFRALLLAGLLSFSSLASCQPTQQNNESKLVLTDTKELQIGQSINLIDDLVKEATLLGKNTTDINVTVDAEDNFYYDLDDNLNFTPLSDGEVKINFSLKEEQTITQSQTYKIVEKRNQTAFYPQEFVQSNLLNIESDNLTFTTTNTGGLRSNFFGVGDTVSFTIKNIYLDASKTNKVIPYIQAMGGFREDATMKFTYYDVENTMCGYKTITGADYSALTDQSFTISTTSFVSGLGMIKVEISDVKQDTEIVVNNTTIYYSEKSDMSTELFNNSQSFLSKSIKSPLGSSKQDVETSIDIDSLGKKADITYTYTDNVTDPEFYSLAILNTKFLIPQNKNAKVTLDLTTYGYSEDFQIYYGKQSQLVGDKLSYIGAPIKPTSDSFKDNGNNSYSAQLSFELGTSHEEINNFSFAIRSAKPTKGMSDELKNTLKISIDKISIVAEEYSVYNSVSSTQTPFNISANGSNIELDESNQQVIKVEQYKNISNLNRTINLDGLPKVEKGNQTLRFTYKVAAFEQWSQLYDVKNLEAIISINGIESKVKFNTSSEPYNGSDYRYLFVNYLELGNNNNDYSNINITFLDNSHDITFEIKDITLLK